MSITDVSIPRPDLAEVIEILTFNGGYNTNAVIVGTMLLGISAGTIGAFSLLRKRALMGDALSHATLPGIAIAFLVATFLGFDGQSIPILLVGAAVTGILGVLTVLFISRQTRLHEDAAIGIVLSVFFGAGAVLIQAIARMDVGNQGGLDQFIYGQTAAMNGRDTIVLGAVAITVVVVALAFMKEFRLVCFDADYASSQGWPVTLIDVIMMTFVVVVTVVGLQTVGLILIVALIIIPAAAARFWTERLFPMVVTSALIGGVSGYLGASTSALFSRMPAGAVIVLMAGMIFIFSMFCAPARGVIAAVIRKASLRDLTNRQHVLRAMFEAGEGRTEATTVPRIELMHRRSWQPRTARRAMQQLVRTGHLIATFEPDTQYRLTQTGRREASRVTRNHRLWETYLVTHADLAPSHVDWSADLVEHVLSPELIEKLEASLESTATPAPPPSVHPLNGGGLSGGVSGDAGGES